MGGIILICPKHKLRYLARLHCDVADSCVAGDLQDWCSVKKTDGSYKNSYVCYTNQKDECCDMCNRVHSPNTKGNTK